MASILVIGGTRFFGKKLVKRLIDHGDTVTVMTRTSLPPEFQGYVNHLQCDRTNFEDFKTTIGAKTFDIIYDNINYSPQEATQTIEVFAQSNPRYIFTSTLSVHDMDGRAKVENDFDPTTYPLIAGDSSQFDYGEGKRQAEAAYFQKAAFPVVAVRFPMVLGEDDYTQRLLFHIERIEQQKMIAFVNLDAKMGFIHSDEAADFLFWAGRETFTGPIHAASHGQISMQSLISLIEHKTTMQAMITNADDEKNLSPFAIPQSWYMNTDYAASLGFSFSTLDDWLPSLIEKLKNN